MRKVLQLSIVLFFISIMSIQAQNIVTRVWYDLNANGIQDGGEPSVIGIPNSVELFDNDTGLSVGVSTGDGTGLYTFSGVVDGNYFIRYYGFTAGGETAYVTAGNWDGSTTDAGDGTDDSDIPCVVGDGTSTILGDSHVFPFAAADSPKENVDAGFFVPAKIGDFVWEDINGDGLSNGEPGLDGINISITDAASAAVSDADGNPLNAIISAGGGVYSFEKLIPGDYILTFDDQIPTYYHTTESLDDPDGFTNDSDAAEANGQTVVMTVVSGDDFDHIDAGFYRLTSVGDFVFHDLDYTGIFDNADVGLAGITVNLLDAAAMVANDINGVPQTMLTDAGGNYLFDDLPPGNYSIQFDPTVDPDWRISVKDINGLGDPTAGNNDSDANTANGQTDFFILESGALLQANIDCGIYKQLDVGGTIWKDGDHDCMIGATEAGVSAVSIDLIDDMGVVVDNQLSNGTGDYLFTDVDPGENYIIRVVGNNFAGGSPLNLHQSSPCQGGDDDIDNDDNGDDAVADGSETVPFTLVSTMEPEDDTSPGSLNTTFDFGFFIEFDCNSSSLSLESCELVEMAGSELLLCDLTDMDGYCATMGEDLVAPFPNPLCPGGGGAHNMSWFSFVAGDGNYQIQVTPYNCTSIGGEDPGIQTGVYTDCSFDDAVICDPSCNTNTVTLSSAFLQPGQVYYFFLDGCSGSVCDYDVAILGNYTPFQLPEPTGLTCDLPDCDIDPLPETCPNSNIEFEVLGLDLEIEYHWNLPAGVTVVNPNPIGDDITDENKITIEFPNTGEFTICMTTATNSCDNTDNEVCKTIKIVDYPDEIFMDTVCNDYIDMYSGPTDGDPNQDGIIGWQVNGTDWTSNPITGTATTPEGCEYTQTLELEVIPTSPEGVLDTAGCMAFTIPDPLGNTIPINNNAENLSLTFPGGSTQGCDSSMLITAYILNIDGTLSDPVCIGNNKVLVTFTQSNISPNPNTVLDLMVDYEWIGADGNVIPDADGFPKTAETDLNGTLTLRVTLEIFGVQCVYDFPIDIDIDNLLPPESVIDGDLTICDNVTESSYTATNTDPNIIQWNWTVPAPATISFGDLSDSIVVSWNGASGGQICVAAESACGIQDPETCITVDLTPAPIASFNLANEVCRDSITLVSFDGVSTAATNFNWDFGDGAIQGSTTSTEEGPHEVSWSDAGNKMIILNMTENGCPAIPDTQFIEVVPPPVPPVLTCIADQNSITFSWTELAGATYTIETIQGPTTGTLDEVNREYIVTGLVDGDEVEIVVVADNGGICGAVYSLPAQCGIQACTPNSVSISIPNDSICIDGTAMTQTITAVIDPVDAGVGTFSCATGGIVDATLGTFDPNIAGAGTHIIKYQFIRDSDDCVANASPIVVVIAEMPTSLFDISSTNICVADTVSISYTGNNSSAVYDWDFGDGVELSSGGVGPFNVKWGTDGEKTITLTVTNSFCESETTIHTVTVDPELQTPNISCGPNGSSTAIEFIWDPVANADSYDISIDGAASTNQSNTDILLSGLTAGDSRFIEVTAVSNNSCPSVRDTLTCYATECPHASFTGLTEICISDSLVLEYVGDTHDDIYWDTDVALVDGVSTVDRKVLRWTTPGTYNVYLKTNKSDCQEIIYQSTITVAPVLDAIVIDCNSTLNSIDITWNSQDCVDEYEVYINGTSIGTITDTHYLMENLNEGDDVDIRVIGISTCICGDVATSVQCSANACPTVNISLNIPYEEICIGDVLTPFAVTANIDDNSGTTSWESNPSGHIDANGMFDPYNLAPGVYEVICNYTIDACSYSEKGTVSIYPRPILVADPFDPDCYKENTGSVLYNATVEGTTLVVTLDNAEIPNSGMKEGLAPGNHSMAATSSDGCIDDTLFIIQPAVEPGLIISGPPTIPVNQSAELVYAGVSGITGSIDSVQWTSSEGILCDQGLCESITITPVIDDEYCVKIWYNNGCDIEKCFVVRLEALKVEVINIFTPGSDDGNGVFKVSFFNTGHQLKSMRIFDRWGSRLFSTKVITDNAASWDGRFNGENVKPGVYIYVIETILDDGEVRVYSGDVTIVK